MVRPKLDITAGEVTEVQLSSETLEMARGRRAQGLMDARIINRMRVFVRTDSGREEDFDFDDAECGVRHGHRVVVIQGSDRIVKKPVNLMLINVSTDEREEFADGFAAFTERPGAFGPQLRAFGLSLVFFAFAYLSGRIFLDSPAGSVLFWSIILSLLAYLMFWAGCLAWDTLTARIRAERGRNAIRADIEGRLAAHIRPPPARAEAGA